MERGARRPSWTQFSFDLVVISHTVAASSINILFIPKTWFEYFTGIHRLGYNRHTCYVVSCSAL